MHAGGREGLGGGGRRGWAHPGRVGDRGPGEGVGGWGSPSNREMAAGAFTHVQNTTVRSPSSHSPTSQSGSPSHSSWYRRTGSAGAKAQSNNSCVLGGAVPVTSAARLACCNLPLAAGQFRTCVLTASAQISLRCSALKGRAAESTGASERHWT